MPLDVFQFNLTQKCGIIKYAIDKGQTEGLFDQEKEQERFFVISERSTRASKMNIKVGLQVKDYNLAKSLHIEVPQLPVDLIISIKKRLDNCVARLCVSEKSNVARKKYLFRIKNKLM